MFGRIGVSIEFLSSYDSSVARHTFSFLQKTADCNTEREAENDTQYSWKMQIFLSVSIIRRCADLWEWRRSLCHYHNKYICSWKQTNWDQSIRQRIGYSYFKHYCFEKYFSYKVCTELYNRYLNASHKVRNDSETICYVIALTS